MSPPREHRPRGHARPPSEPTTLALAIRGPVTADGVEPLCELVTMLLADAGVDVLVCDVGRLVDPDAAVVGALARLQLTARRMGSRICLRGASPELRELLGVSGLTRVVPCEGEDLPP